MKLEIKLPQFSLTRGQIPADVGPGRGRLRRFRDALAWGGVAFGFFVLFAWLCLPTRAIAWRINHEARKAGFVVDVKDVSVSLLGTITLEDVSWTFAPSRPDQIPSKFYVDEIDVDVSLLSLLIGNVDVELEARPAEGRIFGHYERDSSSSSIKVAVEELPLYDVPKARQALNAPLLGLFALKLELELPNHKFAKASGSLELSCTACRIGDGEAKLYMPGSRSSKDGTVIPEIDLGTFVGKLIIDKGVAKTEGAMETRSDDVEISVEGEVDLKDPVMRSRPDLTIKVNLTKTLQDRSEKLRLAFGAADPKSRLDPPEQGLGYIVSGSFQNPQLRGIKTRSARETQAEKRARQRKKDEARRAKKAAASGGDRPPLPGTPSPVIPQPGVPLPTGPGGAMPGEPGTPGAPGMPGEPTMPPPPSGPMPTAPGENGLDVINVPADPAPTGEQPADPNAGEAPPMPPTEPPPAAEPPSAEPPAAEPPAEVPSVLPPDGSFGSGGQIGEPLQ